MAIKKSSASPGNTNFSVRLPDEDVRRVTAIAAAHEWAFAKVIQKLVKAALDAKLLK